MKYNNRIITKYTNNFKGAAMSSISRFILFYLSFLSITASAAIDFVNEPMSVQSDGAPPNVMLVMDDSGSMGVYQNGRVLGDDMLYFPGYDQDKEYRCSSGTVLDSVEQYIVELRISTRYRKNKYDYRGVPFFTYNHYPNGGTVLTNVYGWGTSGNVDGAAGLPNNTTSNVCFNPEQNYVVRLRANEKGSDVSAAPGEPAIPEESVSVKAGDYYCDDEGEISLTDTATQVGDVIQECTAYEQVCDVPLRSECSGAIESECTGYTQTGCDAYTDTTQCLNYENGRCLSTFLWFCTSYEQVCTEYEQTCSEPVLTCDGYQDVCNTGYVDVCDGSYTDGACTTFKDVNVGNKWVCNAGLPTEYDATLATEDKITVTRPGVPAVPPRVKGGDYLYAPESEEKIYSGNFLNWYLSATLTEWSDNTLSGNYLDWTEASSTSCSTSPFTCFQYTKTDNEYFWKWNNSEKNPNKQLTTAPPGELGDESEDNTTGYKMGVRNDFTRMAVANDVAMNVVRKVGDLNMALSSFKTKGNGKKGDTEGHIMRMFLPIDSEESINALPLAEQAAARAKSNASRLALIEGIYTLKPDGATPSAEALSRVADYFFTGWESETFKFNSNSSDANLDNEDRVKSDRNISSSGKNDPDRIFKLGANIGDIKGSSIVTKQTDTITETLFCQKNAVAMLTDGLPNDDDSTGASELNSYSPSNLSGNVQTGRGSPLVRLAGALYDHDFLTTGEFEDTFNNITSYYIGFGEEKCFYVD